MSRLNKTLGTGLVIAGVGIGSATAPVVEKTEYLPSKPVEIPVRFEEAHHKVDESLRQALKLKEGSTNQDLIDLVKELAKQNKALTTENKKLVSVVNKRKSAVSKYYQKNGG